MAFEFDWDANEEKVKIFKSFMNKNRDKKGVLMSVLHKAQDLFGYIPIEIQRLISEELDIPLSEIYGVATFYSQFSLVPKGENEISVCLGTACYVKGAQEILDELIKVLGIGVGETTPDGKFSIGETRCLGACGLAPVMVVNDDVYGKLKRSDVKEIIDKYR